MYLPGSTRGSLAGHGKYGYFGTPARERVQMWEVLGSARDPFAARTPDTPVSARLTAEGHGGELARNRPATLFPSQDDRHGRIVHRRAKSAASGHEAPAGVRGARRKRAGRGGGAKHCPGRRAGRRVFAHGFERQTVVAEIDESLAPSRRVSREIKRAPGMAPLLKRKVRD